jgi:hypothetical protein
MSCFPKGVNLFTEFKEAHCHRLVCICTVFRFAVFSPIIYKRFGKYTNGGLPNGAIL